MHRLVSSQVRRWQMRLWWRRMCLPPKKFASTCEESGAGVTSPVFCVKTGIGGAAIISLSLFLTFRRQHATNTAKIAVNTGTATPTAILTVFALTFPPSISLLPLELEPLPVLA
jgi:hypothetical protein